MRPNRASNEKRRARSRGPLCPQALGTWRGRLRGRRRTYRGDLVFRVLKPLLLSAPRQSVPRGASRDGRRANDSKVAARRRRATNAEPSKDRSSTSYWTIHVVAAALTRNGSIWPNLHRASNEKPALDSGAPRLEAASSAPNTFTHKTSKSCLAKEKVAAARVGARADTFTTREGQPILGLDLLDAPPPPL